MFSKVPGTNFEKRLDLVLKIVKFDKKIIKFDKQSVKLTNNSEIPGEFRKQLDIPKIPRSCCRSEIIRN